MHDLTNYLETQITDPKAKKRAEKGNEEPYNASFLTLENIRWWLYVSQNYIVPANKRVFFLPCAGGFKTRGKERINDQGQTYIDNRKFISESTSHQFMKAIREDPQNECIILSEPCTIIPYCMEKSPMRPDYNLPVDFLSVQSEFIFIDRVSAYLLKLKRMDPERQFIYYFGGAHHYFILHYANLLAADPRSGETPFQILFRVPERGTATFAKESTDFMTQIHSWELAQSFPSMDPRPLEAELSKRSGRYTHKPFIMALFHAQHLGNNHTEVKETRVPIANRNAFQNGFGEMYAEISQ
jgi:hypothetical protein